MKLSGEFTAAAPREEVFTKLTDPGFLVQHLPDVSLVEVVGDTEFKVSARVGVSNIRGSLAATVTLLESEPGSFARFAVTGAGIGSRVRLTIEFTLVEKDPGTCEVQWSGEADIAGRLASVGAGLIEPIVRSNTEALVASVQRGLAGQAAPAVAAPEPPLVEIPREPLRLVLTALAALLLAAVVYRLVRRR